MVVFIGVSDNLVHLDAQCPDVFRKQVLVFPVWAGLIAVQNRDSKTCFTCCTGD